MTTIALPGVPLVNLFQRLTFGSFILEMNKDYIFMIHDQTITFLVVNP